MDFERDLEYIFKTLSITDPATKNVVAGEFLGSNKNRDEFIKLYSFGSSKKPQGKQQLQQQKQTKSFAAPNIWDTDGPYTIANAHSRQIASKVSASSTPIANEAFPKLESTKKPNQWKASSSASSSNSNKKPSTKSQRVAKAVEQPNIWNPTERQIKYSKITPTELEEICLKYNRINRDDIIDAIKDCESRIDAENHLFYLYGNVVMETRLFAAATYVTKETSDEKVDDDNAYDHDDGPYDCGVCDTDSQDNIPEVNENYILDIFKRISPKVGEELESLKEEWRAIEQEIRLKTHEANIDSREGRVLRYELGKKHISSRKQDIYFVKRDIADRIFVSHNKHLSSILLTNGLSSIEIDLHHLWLDEAIERLQAMIDLAHTNKWSSLKIVTGKGTHSKSPTPILYTKIGNWLKNSKGCLGIAKIVDGAGCYDVFLR